MIHVSDSQRESGFDPLHQIPDSQGSLPSLIQARMIDPSGSSASAYPDLRIPDSEFGLRHSSSSNDPGTRSSKALVRLPFSEAVTE